MVSLQQVVVQLARHDAVGGVLIIGSAAKGEVAPDSDYDLVLVLNWSPAPLDVALTYIDRRMTDVIFVTAAQIEYVLTMDGLVGEETPVGRIIRWLQAGEIAFDRAGNLRHAQEKVRSGVWLESLSDAQVYRAWYGINFNLAHTRRMLASADPLRLAAADIRLAIYASGDLLWNYFCIRKIRWEGEKAAVMYLSVHDPAYLRDYQQFLTETDRQRKLALYEQLAAQATAPAGGLWKEHTTAIQFGSEVEWTPNAVQDALAFWEDLLSDQGAV